MKAIQTTIYKCDYCNNSLRRKSLMEWHEKWCVNNPINHHACFEGCNNLKKVEYRTNEFMEDSFRHMTGYYCTALSKSLYSCGAMQKKLLEKHPESFIGKELMPIKCEFKDTRMLDPFTNEAL